MLSVAIALVVLSGPSPDPLQAGFQNPPLSARPHTWWHWMNGNVTRKGITADLEAMKEVGIGGAQMFTVDQGIPAGPAGYGGKLWREMTTHAIKEANRLGIELCIHNCAGWSSSGGPWIKPEDAMQVLAWSTKVVSGGAIDEALDPIKAPQVSAAIDYRQDIAVFAIPGTPELGKLDSFLGRTGVVRQDGLTPILTPKEGVRRNEILNLTDKFRDGRLVATLPAGPWTILRLGHVPTGKDNHPAPPEGDGLEVDKLSKEALQKHWDGLMAKVIADAGPLAGKSLNNSLIDSYEVHSQNWTPKFRTDFKRLRGYDPLPWMPALVGVTIDSGAMTERFLWDYRRTIADLFAENYFGAFGTLAHQNRLKFSTEPYGDGGFDNIQAGGTADIPMGEFWIGGAAMESTKLASSIGHTYGRPVIGAESFTADDVRGRFLEEPYMMKTVGDLALINGVNRYIFHRYAQQPWSNLKPGMTMGPWGTHLERTQTWWKEAATWLRYVARAQYLLQKGRFVADAVVFAGESAPTDLPYARGANRIVPEGYDYDGCDTKTLLSMQVKSGQIVLPSGMRYRLLILPKSEFMTASVAAKIRSLVSAGAVVVGPAPKHSPSLSGYPATENLVQLIGKEVWGDGSEHGYGMGRVFAKASPAEVLRRIKLAPDFQYTGARAKLLHIHRTIGDAEVYFVSNQRYQSAETEATFRVTGRQPEFWNAETGQITPATVWRAVPGGTTVTLRLQPAESVFVVFRGKPSGPHLTAFSSSKPTAQKQAAINIVSARYETATGTGTDVTAKISDWVKAGETEVEATNANFGDPAVNTVKRLNVRFRIGGKLIEKSVGENETLTLSPTETDRGLLDAEIQRQGKELVLYLWKAGLWTLRDGSAETLYAKEGGQFVGLDANWHVRFAPNLGAPATAYFPTLQAWEKNQNPGIRYFSGSADYVKEFVFQPKRDANSRVRLNLGDVRNFATVKLNGKNLGTLWKPPFVLDVTSAVKAGRNKLEIRVTNLWVNRLIGDEQLPPDVEWNGVQLKSWPEWLLKGQPRPKTGRIAFTTWKFWSKDSPLLPSGLIGPVRLESTRGIRVR